ncbi:hypothetical protein WN55_10096 [Dufourea novaeangliae]|uniref:Uncharacterized protein n=1 Tax=Dufourea novaeangliae TaxID=178035 RepID=A0A154P2V9_DUFNO|nr:hypothetical protein WN55_10096 [Dufourea novaeangliae]
MDPFRNLSPGINSRRNVSVARAVDVTYASDNYTPIALFLISVRPALDLRRGRTISTETWPTQSPDKLGQTVRFLEFDERHRVNQPVNDRIVEFMDA